MSISHDDNHYGMNNSTSLLNVELNTLLHVDNNKSRPVLPAIAEKVSVYTTLLVQ